MTYIMNKARKYLLTEKILSNNRNISVTICALAFKRVPLFKIEGGVGVDMEFLPLWFSYILRDTLSRLVILNKCNFYL